MADSEDFCAGVGVGSFAVGDGTGDGVAAVFNAVFAADAEAALFLLAAFAALEFGEVAALRALDEFEFLFVAAGDAFRLLAFEFLLESGPGMLLGNSRPEFDGTDGGAPGTVNTTSSLFERCSTRAVAPGCSRKETTVLSPLRCAFTSANPRPRRASVRGTSAAGILT